MPVQTLYHFWRVPPFTNSCCSCVTFHHFLLKNLIIKVREGLTNYIVNKFVAGRMEMVYRGYVRLTFPVWPTAYRSHSQATYRTTDNGQRIHVCSSVRGLDRRPHSYSPVIFCVHPTEPNLVLASLEFCVLMHAQNNDSKMVDVVYFKRPKKKTRKHIKHSMLGKVKKDDGRLGTINISLHFVTAVSDGTLFDSRRSSLWVKYSAKWISAVNLTVQMTFMKLRGL